MDLEEYRRVYMRAEGIGNTPINTLKRAARLGKTIAKMPSSARQDKFERRERKEARKEAIEYMKENGFSGDAAIELLQNRHRLENNVSKNVEQIGNAAISMERSFNEFGQTAAAVAGAKRSNTYDSQDLEKGISFALTGLGIVSKEMKLPSKAMEGAVNLVCLSFNVFHMNKDILDGAKNKNMDKSMDKKPMDKTMPEPER